MSTLRTLASGLPVLGLGLCLAVSSGCNDAADEADHARTAPADRPIAEDRKAAPARDPSGTSVDARATAEPLPGDDADPRSLDRTAPGTMADADAEVDGDIDVDAETTQRVDEVTEEAKGAIGKATDPLETAENQRAADAHAADNTGRNARDRNDTSVSPFEQSSQQSDLDITTAIRRFVVDTEDFSIEAQNIKIVTREGRVVLRGPVATERERNRIGDLAKSLAGVVSVENQLEPSEPNEK